MAQADSDQADSELVELSNQMADGAMLSLYRLLDGGEKEFVDEQAVSEFSVGAVARRYGGGRYVIYLRKPHPDSPGQSIRQGSKRFTISGPPRYPTDDPVAAGSVAPGAEEAAKLSSTYGDLIQATVKNSLEQMQMLQAMQLAVISSLTARPPDSGMELMKTLLPALLGRGKPEGITLADALALGDRMASRSTPASSLKETLELLQTAREFAGGEAPTPAWLGVAAKAVEVIGSAIAYNPRQLPAADVAASSPAPVPAPVDVPASTPIEVPIVPASAHPLLQWLAPQMPTLMHHAQQDHEPDNYAGPIVDQLPITHRADVLAFLKDDTFMQQLVTAFPMTQPLRDWFLELRDCVVERIEEDTAPRSAAENG